VTSLAIALSFILIFNPASIAQFYTYQRNLSPNTIRSYRNALNQFVDYLMEQCGYRYRDISFTIFKRDVFVGFISWLNSDQRCSRRTCNQRLAAL